MTAAEAVCPTVADPGSLPRRHLCDEAQGLIAARWPSRNP